MDIEIRGRLIFKYDEEDINSLLEELEGSSYSAPTKRERERAIIKDATDKALEISPHLVLHRPIISLPKRATLIFTEPKEEK